MERTEKKEKSPKIMWGVFNSYPNEVHLIPCYENGEKIRPHIEDQYCVCDPKREYERDIFTSKIQTLFIHQQEN